MEIRPIKTKRDYEAALRQVELLMNAKPNSKEGDQLEILVTLIEAYEAKRYRLDPPDPIEAIKLAMEECNLVCASMTRADKLQ